MKDLNYQENYKEENVMEEHRSYGNFIQKKKQNLIDNHRVFMNLHKRHKFRSKVLRMHNLRQYMAELPIFARKEEFLKAYQENDVIIFKSNAGSGKSTQLPQYLMDCAEGRILVTEPRVIAAENVARRVRSEFTEGGVERYGADKQAIGYVSGPRYEIHPELTQIVYLSEVSSSLQA